jgi:hypothetical protein
MTALISYGIGYTANSAAASSLVIQPPPVYSAGNLLVMGVIAANSSGGVAASVPSGWTRVSGGGATLALFTKTATASESAYTVTLGASSVAGGFVAAYPAATVLSSSFSNSGSNVASWTATFPAGVTSGQTVLLLAGAVANAVAAGDPDGDYDNDSQNINLPSGWATDVPAFGPVNGSGVPSSDSSALPVALGLAEITGTTSNPVLTNPDGGVMYAGFLVLNLTGVTPAPFTVTATSLGPPSAVGIALTVKSLVGALPAAQVLAQGATVAYSAGGVSAAPEMTITPSFTGSVVYGAVTENQGVTGGSTYTAAAGTTLTQNVGDSVSSAIYGTLQSTGTTTASSPVTLGGSAPSNAHTVGALAEIPAAAGQAILEVTSATVNATQTGQYATTAAAQTAVFPSAPPLGSLLVAMVSANAASSLGTAQIAMSDSLGLNWQLMAWEGTPAYAAVFIAQMPAARIDPPAAMPGLPWRRRFQPWRRAAGRRFDIPAVVGASGSIALAPLAVAGSAQNESFPQVPLGLTAEINLPVNGWTDVTSYVYQRDSSTPISIHRGRPDEASQIEPSAATFEVNNRNGNFTVRNPNGAWYGQINRNTPIRFSVPAASTYLRFEDDSASYVTAPDTAPLSITGDTEVQIDLQLSNYVNSVLAAKYISSASNNRSWFVELLADGTVQFIWSADGSTTLNVISTVPLPLGRIALKATLAVATGTVTFYTAPTIGGSWTQLGSAASATSGASTSVYNSTAPVTIGYDPSTNQNLPGINGSVYGFKLLNGIGGTVEAYADFTSQTPGVTSFTDGQGNTWTLAGNTQITARDYRFHGEMSALPVAWDPSGADVSATITAGGLLRRLGQGSAPVISAMKRGVLALTGTLAPVAYWPCEDLAGSTQIASGIGGPAMTVTSGTTFANNTAFACSAAIPTVGGGTWSGTVPTYTSNGSLTVRFLMDITSAPATSQQLFIVGTTGTCAVLAMYYAGTGALGLTAYNSTGTVFDTGGFAFGVDNNPVWVSIELTPAGGSTVDYNLITLQPGASAGLSVGGSFSGTVGNALGITVNYNGAAFPISAGIGHIVIQSGYSTFSALATQLNAYNGETAGNRFARLCTENGFQARIYGAPNTSAAMGVQSVQALPQLLQECEDADRGMIYEPRQVLALGYITHAALCNQPAAATLDYSAAETGGTGQDLKPTYDDQYTRNDLTIQRSSSSSGSSSGSGGASYRATLDDGTAMSISNPPVGVGDYSTSVSVNLQTDSQLQDVAGWLLHLGTVDDYRWPTIPVNMARAEITGAGDTYGGSYGSGYGSPQQAIQAAGLGNRIDIVNPPGWLPPDPIRQLVAQSTEVLGGYHWTITFTGIPESPYETVVLDDTTYGYADTDGSTLTAAATLGATTLSVATTDPTTPAWTTSAGDFPFDIAVAGERMTVTGIASGTALQTAVLADSPSAWWQLADAAGSATAADSSGNGNTGTAANVAFGTAYAPCGTPAASFNGSTSVVTSSYNPVLSAVTVEAWVNLAGRSNGTSTVVLANSHTSVDNKGFELFLFGGTTPEAGFGTGSANAFAVAGSAIAATGWSHLAATWDGTTIILYVNGAQAATAPLSGSLAAGTANVAIGDDPANSSGYVNAFVADAAVYPAALSPARIAAHYAAGSGQTFTVTRSVNSVVKTHSAGEAVSLWTPPVLALQ